MWVSTSQSKYSDRIDNFIRRAYLGLKGRPMEFACFFEVICWQVTSFQMIADSSSKFQQMHIV